jgi:adenylylsulfate kinase-like enzyme
MIIWLTGKSGAGKTAIAKELQKSLDSIILDGDEMRESISLGAGFSKGDRTEHNYRVARLAKVLSKQSNVIVSVIAPIKEVRENITEMINPTWVYLKRELPQKEGHFYEEPENYFMVDIDKGTINENAKKIRRYVHLKKIK